MADMLPHLDSLQVKNSIMVYIFYHMEEGIYRNK